MDQFLKIIQEEAREERVRNFILKYSSKILISLAIILFSITIFLWWNNYKLYQYEKLGDKFIKAIDLISQDNKDEAIILLEDIINSKTSKLSDIALYYKTAVLDQFDQSVYEKLSKSNSDFIKELSNMILNNTKAKYDIFLLLQKEREIIQDIHSKNYKEAMEKIDQYFSRRAIMLPSIEFRINAYRQIIKTYGKDAIE